MGGKGAILLVLGFSLIFMVAGRNFNNMATGTIDNFSSYFYDAKAHNIAATGINLVANQFFLDNSLNDQNFNYNFDDGTAAVSVTTVGNQRHITSIGTYKGTSATIKIEFQSSFFSRFAYFSDNEGADIWWTTDDEIFGPFHTNGQLRVAGSPRFHGKVTIEGSVVKYSHTANPQFLGGIQTGVHIDIPENGVSNLAAAASINGATFTGHDRVYLEFRGDSVRYRYATWGAGSTWQYRLASTFAPNGVIFAENAELRIKGIVKGQYTVGASGTGDNRGKIFLDDDIRYFTNPQDPNIYPPSTDLLGIVAQRDIVITENSANNNNITIQAAMYCETGSFTAQNYQGRPVSGDINLFGGLTQNTRGPVGQFQTDWWGRTYCVNGFNKEYIYDDRLMNNVPPSFPATGQMQIVSWFE